MITTPRPFLLEVPQSEGRGAGVHVSRILKCIAGETGILKAEWLVDFDYALEETGLGAMDDDSILRLCLGLAWEEWYAKQLAKDGVLDHPGEVELDGIKMTPDGESLEFIAGLWRLVVHEYKTTAKSLKRVSEEEGGLESQWLWMAQIKSYCKSKHTRYARLHALFLFGDYKFPMHAQLKVWDLEFTQEELDDNWALVRGYRDHREDEGGTL